MSEIAQISEVALQTPFGTGCQKTGLLEHPWWQWLLQHDVSTWPEVCHQQEKSDLGKSGNEMKWRLQCTWTLHIISHHYTNPKPIAGVYKMDLGLHVSFSCRPQSLTAFYKHYETIKTQQRTCKNNHRKKSSPHHWFYIMGSALSTGPWPHPSMKSPIP